MYMKSWSFKIDVYQKPNFVSCLSWLVNDILFMVFRHGQSPKREVVWIILDDLKISTMVLSKETFLMPMSHVFVPYFVHRNYSCGILYIVQATQSAFQRPIGTFLHETKEVRSSVWLYRVYRSCFWDDGIHSNFFGVFLPPSCSFDQQCFC